MTFVYAMIISGIILASAGVAVLSSKLTYNSLRRKQLRQAEVKQLRKLEKMKVKNKDFYKASKKLANVRMKLNKYHLTSYGELTDTESLTRSQRKQYFKFSRYNQKLQAYRQAVASQEKSENKVKEAKLIKKIAKYHTKSAVEYSRKVPGTYLEIENGVKDIRTGINLGDKYKSQEDAYIAKASEMLPKSHRFPFSKEYTYSTTIESSDAKIDGLFVSSSYEKVRSIGEESLLEVIRQEKSPYSYPFVITKHVKDIYGNMTKIDSIKIKNEKDFDSYYAKNVKKPEPEITK